MQVTRGGGACRAYPLEGSEVIISLHSGLRFKRSLKIWKAGYTFDVAAAHFASQSTVRSLWMGGNMKLGRCVPLCLSWELLTGRYGEDSGGGGGARLDMQATSVDTSLDMQVMSLHRF